MALTKYTLDTILPPTRASGGSYVNAAGNLIGIDFATTTSQAATTGSKTFNVGANRGWVAGQQLRVTPQDNTANMLMAGTVTSYNATTGDLVANITTVGSDTTTTKTAWRIGFSGNRIDHSFSAIGTRLGLLCEGQATNLIANNSTTGAVAGAIGSGGALPTNWNTNSGHGLSVTVGTPGVERGVPYVDLTIAGTVTASPFELFFNSTTESTVAEGNFLSAGAFLKIVSGDLTGITGITQSVTLNESSGTFISRSDYAVTLTANLARYELNHTVADTTPNTARAQLSLRLGLTVSAAVNITIRIGLPQLEVGETLTTPIITIGTQTTRASDLGMIANFSTWALNTASDYTLVAKVRTASQIITLSSMSARAWTLQNSSGTNQVRIMRAFTDGRIQGQGAVSGSTDISFTPANNPGNLTVTKVAGRFKNNDFAMSRDGGSVGIDTSSPNGLPAGMTESHVGFGQSNAFWQGHIQELGFIPRGLSNTELQAKSL